MEQFQGRQSYDPREDVSILIAKLDELQGETQSLRAELAAAIGRVVVIEMTVQNLKAPRRPQ